MASKRDWRSKVARLKARHDYPANAAELQLRVKPDAAPNTTIRYLERVRDLIARETKVDRVAVSNYRIAQRLAIAPNRLSHYYGNLGSMDNKLAYQVAIALGEDPLRVIAELEADRAVREEDRTFWKSIARKVAAIAGAAIGGALLLHALGGFNNNDFAVALSALALPLNLTGIHIVTLAGLAVLTLAAASALERANVARLTRSYGF